MLFQFHITFILFVNVRNINFKFAWKFQNHFCDVEHVENPFISEKYSSVICNAMVCARNIQGFTLFRKRCESLYISGPYLMGRKHTRIHTFSNGSKFEKVWIHVCFLNLKHLDGIYKDSHLFKFGLKKNHLKKCKSL